jgi:hypothetical protein
MGDGGMERDLLEIFGIEEIINTVVNVSIFLVFFCFLNNAFKLKYCGKIYSIGDNFKSSTLYVYSPFGIERILILNVFANSRSFP